LRQAKKNLSFIQIRSVVEENETANDVLVETLACGGESAEDAKDEARFFGVHGFLDGADLFFEI
jgi:hypothetical protein